MEESWKDSRPTLKPRVSPIGTKEKRSRTPASSNSAYHRAGFSGVTIGNTRSQTARLRRMRSTSTQRASVQVGTGGPTRTSDRSVEVDADRLPGSVTPDSGRVLAKETSWPWARAVLVGRGGAEHAPNVAEAIGEGTGQKGPTLLARILCRSPCRPAIIRARLESTLKLEAFMCE